MCIKPGWMQLYKKMVNLRFSYDFVRVDATFLVILVIHRSTRLKSVSPIAAKYCSLSESRTASNDSCAAKRSTIHHLSNVERLKGGSPRRVCKISATSFVP